MKTFLKLILTVTALLGCIEARATSPSTTYAYQLLALPPVVPTNATTYFTNSAGSTFTVTNADGTIWTNSSAPYFIDCHAARFTALEFKASSGVINGTAGVSNVIYKLAPAVVNITNSFSLASALGGPPSPPLFPVTNSLPQFDTNHLITITVPLSVIAGMPVDFVTNLDAAGLAGYWVYSVQSQTLNALITNQVFVSQKNYAP